MQATCPRGLFPPGLLANIGLRWKGLPGPNALAYFASIIDEEKKVLQH
jgi:hypothetical protein